MKIYFDHEKLNAYQESLRFFAWTEPVLERVPKNRVSLPPSLLLLLLLLLLL